MPLASTDVESTEDLIHGVAVADPYRWLENRSSSKTAQWLVFQQEMCESYFHNLPYVDSLRARVTAYLDVDIVDQPSQTGLKQFYRRRRKGSEQACICVRDLITCQETVLVDPKLMGSTTSIEIRRISEDASLLAYQIKHGGEDASEIHFVDVESGRLLPDRLPRGHSRGFVFNSDTTGFYYCHEIPGRVGRHELRFHSFGADADDDQTVFSLPRTIRSRLVLLADDIHLGALYLQEQDGIPRIDLYLSSRASFQKWSLLAAGKPLPYMPFLRCGRVFAITYEGAPNGSIIELSEDGSVRATIVPERTLPLGQCATTANHIYVSYLQFPNTSVSSWDYAGRYHGEVSCPTRSTVRLLPAFTNNAEILFYSVDSFTQAPAIFSHDPQKGCTTRWHQRSAPIDDSNYSVREATYPSKDGTTIPISLVARKDVNIDVPHCTIMTGYGGFGFSMTPQFTVLVAVMLEAGVVFALPNIRGGGEFGAGWHDAARGKRRQVAFDDFISAAAWLCSRGTTTPKRLAIFGGSNSGLLVGAAITQRPDLFQAAVCVAPLLDMVRYERFDRAHKWRVEYGTVDNLEDFLALLAYSPYHHVNDNLNYPSMLFVTGDKDDRCDPAHVRKMVARLQNRPKQTSPILLDYSEDRGHSPVLPLTTRIEALSRRLAFLYEQLCIELNTGDIS